jgi:hypothetical protein
MNIAPPTALAAWAVGTAWLVLFFLLERFDPEWGEEVVDGLQFATFIIALAFFPLFRRWFATWLAKSNSQKQSE